MMSVGQRSGHRCDPDGMALETLAVPGYALPENAVVFTESGEFGRVRLLWKCCGTVLVECVSNPDDPDDPDDPATYMDRWLIRQVAPIPHGTPYSVPCVGAEWSLHLTCGHLAGEGCDCDTIAAEAATQD